MFSWHSLLSGLRVPYLLYVFRQRGLGKKCRPRWDAAAVQIFMIFTPVKTQQWLFLQRPLFTPVFFNIYICIQIMWQDCPSDPIVCLVCTHDLKYCFRLQSIVLRCWSLVEYRALKREITKSTSSAWFSSSDVSWHCIWNLRQIEHLALWVKFSADILNYFSQETGLPWRQFALNVKSCFLGKLRKISICHLLNLPRVVRLNISRNRHILVWRTPKRITGKQCRPISNHANHSIWSGSPLLANSLAIFLWENLNYIAWYTYKNSAEGVIAPAGAKVTGATIRTWLLNKFISFLAVLTWKTGLKKM